MQENISLKELYFIVKKHFFTMLVSILVGAVISALLMMFFITPKFSSEAQLLVNQQGDNAQAIIQNNEIQANIQLINTYRDIITGHSVLSQVNDNLEDNYSMATLGDAISVSQSPNSQAFNLTVTMESPEEAQTILNEFINVFETTIQHVYTNHVASIYVLSPASFNPNKVSPSLTLFLLLGGLIGLVLSLVIVMVIELMDTTVKDEDYLTQLGMINLGQIFELSGKELKQARLNSSSKQNRVRERV